MSVIPAPASESFQGAGPGQLRVLQVIDTLEWGGAQALLEMFATQARAHGIELGVVALDETDRVSPTEARLRDLGIPVFRAPSRKLLDPLRARRLVGRIRDWSPDLAHTHLTGSNIVGATAARIAVVPVVASLHTITEPSGARAALRVSMEALTLRRTASLALASGPSVAACYRDRLGRVPTRVLLNPGPAPFTGPCDVRRDLRRELGLEARQGVFFVVVGRLAREKGVDLVLEAASRLPREPEGFTVAVIGDGALRARLEEQAARLGLADHVIFLGEQGDARRLLPAFDVYVSGARAEGFSMPLLQAMACGLPVVATDAGDANVAVDEAVGALVRPGDVSGLVEAMRRMLRDAEGRRTMGAEAARRVVETFSVDSWTEALVGAYRSVVEAGAPTPFPVARVRRPLAPP